MARRAARAAREARRRRAWLWRVWHWRSWARQTWRLSTTRRFVRVYCLPIVRFVLRWTFESKVMWPLISLAVGSLIVPIYTNVYNPPVAREYNNYFLCVNFSMFVCFICVSRCVECREVKRSRNTVYRMDGENENKRDQIEKKKTKLL